MSRWGVGGRAAAAGEWGATDGVGVTGGRVEGVGGKREDLGGGEGGDRGQSADGHRANGQVHGPVVIGVGGCACGARAIHPKSGCHATTSVCTFQRS